VTDSPASLPRRAWQPLVEHPSECLQANLESLARRFPEAAEEAENADLEGLFYQPVAPEGFQIGRKEGQEITFLAGDDRESAALALVLAELRKRIEEKKSRLYILAGFGTGYVAQRVLQEIVGLNVGILVLEPDSALLRAALSLTDLRPVLESRKFFFAVGERLLNQAEKTLDRYHLFPIPELCLLFRQTDIPREEGQRYVGWVQELARRKRHLELRYNQHVLAFLKRPRAIRADAIRKVWVREMSADCAEYSRVQAHLAERFVRAIADSGCTVARAPSEPETFYPPFYAVHSLMEADAELALIFNDISTVSGVLGESFSKSLAIPKVSWFVDAPLTLFENLSERGLGPGDILTSTDRHWFEDVRGACPEMANRTIHYLPLAATYDEVGPMDPAWQCPVSYVGQVRDQSHIFNSPQLKKPIRRILDRIAEALMRHRRLRPETLLEQAPELQELATRYDLGEFFRKFYTEIIWEANSRYRERAMLALADLAIPGLGLRLYGNADWAVRTRGTPLEACFTGRTVAHDDLPRLYRNSAINVNVHHLQSSTSLNLRLFDVPAAGGFLITDYMEGLEELFEIGREVVVYRTLEELREKVLYYLDHPDERQEIAERARERVLREHTFAHRWKTLLEIVRKEGWT